MLVGLGALAFIPFLGAGDLFDWDEINFAEISREMIVLGDYLRVHVDFKPFWEKPPFFFWMQVLAMKSFGIGEFAARLPNALCGIATLVVIYKIGCHLFDRRFGALWSLTYFGTIFPHMYFKTGLIDPWFNFFIFLGLYFFIVFSWKRSGLVVDEFKRKPLFYLCLSGLIIGLGILTKGPVALLVPGLCIAVFTIIQRFRLPASIPQFALWIVLSFVTMITWYGFETIKNGPWFVQEFTKYQIHLFTQPGAGQDGFPGYHFVVNLFGVFPASIIALPALIYLKPKSATQRLFRHWMNIFFWVVIILFSIVESKIIHYSSLTYFPLTFLSTLTIIEVVEGRARWKSWMSKLLGFLGILIGLAVAATPIVGRNIVELLQRFDIPDAIESVNVNVSWPYWMSIFGLLLVGGIIAFFVQLNKSRLVKGYIILLLCTGVMTNALTVLFYPRILNYSQGPAVEFFKSLQDEDCYVTTLGYKSYAQFFYTRKSPQSNPRSSDTDWLLTGDIDKQAYFVTQTKDLERFQSQQPRLEVVGRKGRFVFLRRSP